MCSEFAGVRLIMTLYSNILRSLPRLLRAFPVFQGFAGRRRIALHASREPANNKYGSQAPCCERRLHTEGGPEAAKVSQLQPLSFAPK